MLFEVLIVATQSRSSGYNSRKHKLNVLVGLDLLIWPRKGTHIYEVIVPDDRLKEVELKLQRANIGYRKVPNTCR